MKTDNELIAEFMGASISYLETVGENWCSGMACRSSDLKYDTSWDWLMPVVEKISQHIYETYPDCNGYKETVNHDRAHLRTFGMIDNEGRWMVRINRMPLEQEDTLIKSTYQAVVEFIKWYNSTKTL